MAKSKSSILTDFLLVVIIAITILLFSITYLNITDKKKSLIKELSESLKYTSRVLLKDACYEAIENDNTEKFHKIIQYLMSESKNKFFEINLYKFYEETKADIIYSTNLDNMGKEIESEEFKNTFSNSDFIGGEDYYNKVHVYVFSDSIKINGKLEGAINIVVSLVELDKHNKNLMIYNVLITIITLILMISITTFMLLKRIYNPINALIKEVKKIKNGDIAYEVTTNVNNELSELAHEINEMKASIWEHTMDNRFSNPVTGLPGLMYAVEYINDLLDRDEFFSSLFVEIKSYEAYILSQGFNKWEEVLRIMVKLFDEALKKNEITKYKLTQIREAQFLLIVPPEKSESVAQTLVENFDFEMKEICKDVIVIKNSKGEQLTFRPMTLFIGIVANKIRGEIKSYKDVENAIFSINIDYLGENEKSQYIIYGGKTGKVEDNIIKEVSEKVDENVKKEKNEEDLLKELRLE